MSENKQHLPSSVCRRIKDLGTEDPPPHAIAALIVNWNGSSDTNELIESLASVARDEYPIGLFVVDNASRNEELELVVEKATAIQDAFAEVVIFRCSSNVGVPAAYNIAALLSGYRYLYLLRLDNDVTLAPGGLSALVAAMKTEPSICVVGGNIRYYSRREENNGGAVTVDLRTGLTSVEYPLISREADGVLGCIMLISSEFAARTAPYVHDSSLFICTDETEVSLRAKEMGLKTWYVSSVIGYHKSGASTSKVSAVSRYYSGRNWTYLRGRYIGKGSRLEVWTRMVLTALGHLVLKPRSVYPAGVLAGAALSIDRWCNRRIWRKEEERRKAGTR